MICEQAPTTPPTPAPTPVSSKAIYIYTYIYLRVYLRTRPMEQRRMRNLLKQSDKTNGAEKNEKPVEAERGVRFT
jgi:hypothetical protein